MPFVDQVKLRLKAGDGGPGAVSFRRQAFEPRGGPMEEMGVEAVMSFFV